MLFQLTLEYPQCCLFVSGNSLAGPRVSCARRNAPAALCLRSRGVFDRAGFFLGNKSAVGKVRHPLSDTSRIWEESSDLVMSACDLRWPYTAESASESNLFPSVGKECAYVKPQQIKLSKCVNAAVVCTPGNALNAVRTSEKKPSTDSIRFTTLTKSQANGFPDIRGVASFLTT